MLDNKLKDLINDAKVVLGLPFSVIEKDYFVTQVIHALSGLENDYFRLIFCGGTSLAKAHKIVKRMSEDVDFKIECKKITKALSKSQFLKELKIFRASIISRLNMDGLTLNTVTVRNERKYMCVDRLYF